VAATGCCQCCLLEKGFILADFCVATFALAQLVLGFQNLEGAVVSVDKRSTHRCRQEQQYGVTPTTVPFSAARGYCLFAAFGLVVLGITAHSETRNTSPAVINGGVLCACMALSTREVCAGCQACER
jgi:hypothetical protein